MLKKLILIFSIFFLVLGCDSINPDGDGDEINIYGDNSAPAESNMNQNSECVKFDLDRIPVIVESYDDYGHLDTDIIQVAERIYQKSLNAIDQCYDYVRIADTYRWAMEYINAGDDPDIVGGWFDRTMIDYVGFDPEYVCPEDGCST